MNFFANPAVREILGEGLAKTLSDVFGQIEIAEEEIAAAGGSKDDRDDPVWRSFMLLRPGDEISFPSERLYRIHCRELIERVKADEDLRPPTDAEILAEISAVSFTGPLARGVVVLQERLLAKHYPAEYASIGESYPSRADEALADEWDEKLRRRLRQKWRVPSTESSEKEKA